MGFLAPVGTLAEEPPSLWAGYLWGPAAPWWLVPVMALLGVARFCLILYGPTVSLDVATCCQAFWYWGHKTTGNRMSAMNKRCSVYQPRDSQRCPGGLCRSAKAGTPPIGY